MLTVLFKQPSQQGVPAHAHTGGTRGDPRPAEEGLVLLGDRPARRAEPEHGQGLPAGWAPAWGAPAVGGGPVRALPGVRGPAAGPRPARVGQRPVRRGSGAGVRAELRHVRPGGAAAEAAAAMRGARAGAGT